jgi:hypothetical protein
MVVWMAEQLVGSMDGLQKGRRKKYDVRLREERKKIVG